ncbi:MAG: recombination mediator RecR [Ignavibacteria bacterium]|nr:recombination mediator RecR [Ignavibacteria bacterium]
MIIPEPLQLAIEEFSKFPGIGKKTAQRLALFLLRRHTDDVNRFIAAIEGLKENLHQCKTCYNITSSEYCEICSSPKRDHATLCVVEDASDIFAIERSNQFNGKYHVLGGVLSPLSGVGPESLKVKELLERLKSEDVHEVILALNPNTEGETTALYINKLLRGLPIKVTRIARGLPIGGDLEFSDEATIGRAVIGRVEYT